LVNSVIGSASAAQLRRRLVRFARRLVVVKDWCETLSYLFLRTLGSAERQATVELPLDSRPVPASFALFVAAGGNGPIGRLLDGDDVPPP
jgi:hypothetical protein